MTRKPTRGSRTGAGKCRARQEYEIGLDEKPTVVAYEEWPDESGGQKP